jgi:hypothetical protein
MRTLTTLRQWRRADRARDEGSALMFAMVFVLLGSLMIVPLLTYSSVVLKSGRTQGAKANRAEAVRGSLRVALADAGKLYAACDGSGMTAAHELASPDLGVPVHTECTTVGFKPELNPADLRVAMATTQAGSLVPLGTQGAPYAGSGNANPDAWIVDSTNTSAGNKIYLPYLPTHGLNHPANGGYMMPSWAGSCRVYFPGTYDSPVNISDGIPTFFTSGVYYFESTVTFGPGANVVVGDGAIEGCASSSEAAFYAVNAPTSIHISGIGGTFIFGATGRLIVTDGGTANGPSLRFNSRLVDSTDVGYKVSAGVSIVSVNGVAAGATSSSELNLPGQLHVPKSLTEANPGDAVAPVDAASTNYKASTLVPTVLPAAPAAPIIDVQLTGTSTTTLYVPGYVGVPQGTISVQVGAGMGANKSVQLLGGVLAAQITQTVDLPADNQLGIINRVVQQTFKLVAKTTSGKPQMVSIAIVQINDFGEAAINSWVTTTP